MVLLISARGERRVLGRARCVWHVARGEKNSACDEKVAARNEKVVSLRTVTDLQGLDQARLISTKNL